MHKRVLDTDKLCPLKEPEIAEMKKRALFSLYSLEKAVEFAKALSDLGWEIIASQETCAELTPRGYP